MYVGIDIIEIKRIERLFSANEGFLKKIYTENEVAYCNGRKNKYQHFAARFAAKEAMFKALGTGWVGTMKWTDIETLMTKRAGLSQFVRKRKRTGGQKEHQHHLRIVVSLPGLCYSRGAFGGQDGVTAVKRQLNFMLLCHQG